MVKDIINEVIEKYYKKYEEYYSRYRYDEGENEFNMEKELESVLDEKGINYVIGMEDGFSSCAYDNDFLAVAYTEKDGKLGLITVLLECM